MRANLRHEISAALLSSRYGNEAAAEAARRAESPPGEIARKIVDLENHRKRTKDAYVVGAFELPELQKRLAGIEGELSVLDGLLERVDEPIQVDPELIAEVARVFVRWPRLRREDKRNLLRAYRIQAFISRPERGVLQIEHIDIGVAGFPSGVRIFKKLKRYGMQ